MNKIDLLYKYPILHNFYDLYKRVKNSFYFNSIPFNNEDYVNPFFIVGSGRSGNTLLRRILNAKEGIVIPPETYVLGKVIRLHKVHKNLDWDVYVNLVLSTYEYHSEFYTFEIDSLSDLALELKNIKAKKRSLAYIINSFYEYYGKINNLGLNRWGDKTPTNSLYVYRIKELFPDSQFVHIIRDGVDVVNSYINAGIYDDYYKAGLRWKGSVNFLRGFGERYQESYYEVRYEELVKSPEKEVSKVCNFLNIPFNKQEMINSKGEAKKMGDVAVIKHHKNVHKPINTRSIGKGRIEINVEQKEKLRKLLNNTLKKLGYMEV